MRFGRPFKRCMGHAHDASFVPFTVGGTVTARKSVTWQEAPNSGATPDVRCRLEQCGGTRMAQSETPERTGQSSGAVSLRILVVEDEPSLYEPLREILGEEGHQVTVAVDGPEAEAHLADTAFDLLITDVRLPKGDGLQLFRTARRARPELQVIIMSAYASVSQAAAAMRDDALYFFEKPFALAELRSLVQEVASRKQGEVALRSSPPQGDDWLDASLVGQTPAMQQLKDRIRSIAASEAAVLVGGESGTGKELIALAIHRLSPRKAGPFVAVNCAAFPDSLLESELFGHERGAFTGAVARREGRFQAAQGGTLFLDEVADMSSLVQAKLLRVLEERSFQPLGTNRTQKTDVRIVSATNALLPSRVAEGKFRADLYYRLKVFTLSAPPLRERRRDLPLLIAHFASQASRQGMPEFSGSAWAALMGYDYPGNVRELRHAMEHALVLSNGESVRPEHLPPEMLGAGAGAQPSAEFRPLHDAWREFEHQYLLQALARTDGNRTRAAQLLGISRKTLWEKLRRGGTAGAPLSNDPL